MFIMAMHGPERRTDTMVLSIRQLLPISTGKRAGPSRQAKHWYRTKLPAVYKLLY